MQEIEEETYSFLLDSRDAVEIALEIEAKGYREVRVTFLLDNKALVSYKNKSPKKIEEN
jgi:hypothetical protein